MSDEKRILIMVNKSCKFQCDKCYKNCNTQFSEKIEREVILDLLNKLPTTVKSVCFTGGEPFENYEDLRSYISLTRELNIKAEISTTCFWADSHEYTYEVLKELKKAGLAKIVIEYDAVFNNREKIINVINVLDVAKEIRIGISLNITNLKEVKIGDEINKLGSRILEIDIKILKDRINKKYNMLKNDDIKKNISSYFVNCDGNVYLYMQGHILDFDPLGNIYGNGNINELIGEEQIG